MGIASRHAYANPRPAGAAAMAGESVRQGRFRLTVHPACPTPSILNSLGCNRNRFNVKSSPASSEIGSKPSAADRVGLPPSSQVGQLYRPLPRGRGMPHYSLVNNNSADGQPEAAAC